MRDRKLYTIALLSTVLLFSGLRTASETASHLLAKAQANLLNTPFGLDYTADMKEQERGGAVLRGKLLYENSHVYYLTNDGGYVVERAEMVSVSNGKDSLRWLDGTFEWRPSHLGYEPTRLDITNLITDGIIRLIIHQLDAEADKLDELRPTHLGKHKTAPWRRIGDLQLLEDSRSTNGNTWHLKFNVSFNADERFWVDLWLDAKSLFPIERSFSPSPDGPPIVEHYSFTSHARINPDMFEPRKVFKDERLRVILGQRINDAEKPNTRLLNAIWEGDGKQFSLSLKAGADINGTTDFPPDPLQGFTPLGLAKQCGRANFIEELIKRGAK